MTLEKKNINAEAAMFEGTAESAIEIRDWILTNNSDGRVELELDVEGVANRLAIRTKKGSWLSVTKPGWIVRMPTGDHKFYTVREFRVRYGSGSWRMK